MILHNTIDRRLLRQTIAEQAEARKTLSFYRYVRIPDPSACRDQMYLDLSALGVLGRIYVATEGINAQITVPESRWQDWTAWLDRSPELSGVRINLAVEHDTRSFFKLKIKVRAKIVADGLDDNEIDLRRSGIHLDAAGFNQLAENPETVIVDMRNHYESAVGHFEGAICPDVDTFRESLPVVADLLAGQRHKPVIMYCTGGIRCEKASAYLLHQGFTEVYQLDGGIIQYTRDAREKGLPNKFKGVNFVFDERMGERISEDVLTGCADCGQPCDRYRNCCNPGCNLLMTQCEACEVQLDGCCSEDCRQILLLPEAEQRALRKGRDTATRIFSKGRRYQPIV
ncbi:MAG: rhodanese-related sulfurtransferase [Bacteroidia bacterium]|nr:rhodanese-related sulfurtransferase [Bacteroidia bacterium]